MLRSFGVALAAIMALSAASPSEAATSRRHEATAAKATRAPAVRPATGVKRTAATAARTQPGATGTRSRAVSTRSGRGQPRAAARREAYRSTGRVQQAMMRGERPRLRLVGLVSSPAAAGVPSRGSKLAKASSRGGFGSWHAGLPADGEQMDCPAGTMAVLARGHSDTFRCMPM